MFKEELEWRILNRITGSTMLKEELEWRILNRITGSTLDNYFQNHPSHSFGGEGAVLLRELYDAGYFTLCSYEDYLASLSQEKLLFLTSQLTTDLPDNPDELLRFAAKNIPPRLTEYPRWKKQGALTLSKKGKEYREYLRKNLDDIRYQYLLRDIERIASGIDIVTGKPLDESYQDFVKRSQDPVLASMAVFCILTGGHIRVKEINRYNIDYGTTYSKNKIQDEVSLCYAIDRLNESSFSDTPFGHTPEYRILAVLDRETCPRCGMMDGKVFPISSAKIGVNYPPFHAGCRCCAVSVFPYENLAESKRRYRDPFTGKSDNLTSASTTYLQWRDEMIEKYGEDIFYNPPSKKSPPQPTTQALVDCTTDNSPVDVTDTRDSQSHSSFWKLLFLMIAVGVTVAVLAYCFLAF